MSEYITEWQFDETVGMLPHGKMREKIVRCKDCKFYKHEDSGYWCLRSISTKSNHHDGFCAWGEHKWTKNN